MTCNDCVHVEACNGILNGFDIDIEFFGEQVSGCKNFKDRSLFVELPCKVGDTVYVIEDIAGEWKIIKDHIETISIGYYADGVSLYQFDGIKTDGYFEDFGKTVFLTREEAERALKERENDA